MDPKLGPLLLLRLLLLCWLVPGVVSLCNVSCSTDYDISLNCSCGASATSHPVLIQVSCSNEVAEVNGTCEVEPPRSWCEMFPDRFEDVVSIETQCNATAFALVGNTVRPAGSSSWLLSEVVKPPPPFGVRVASTEESYNISWNHSNREDCLTYRLCTRASEEASEQDQCWPEVTEYKHLPLNRKKLRPYVRHTVKVQAKMCDGNLYEGPWSEWSPAVEWRTRGADETEATEGWHNWRLVYLPPSVLLIIVMLVCLVMKLFKNKIPDPNEFFKPLYSIHGGNFKEWVKPVFSEYDFLRISSQPPTTSGKQLEVGQATTERQNCWASSSGQLFPALQPGDNSLLFFLEGGRSDCTAHSAGQISIHTVTLSGDGELLEEGAALSESSATACRGQRPRENFGAFGGDDREQVAFLFEEPAAAAARHSRHSGVSENLREPSRHSSAEALNFPPHVDFAEAERASLDSFVFNERSDDGYPHVDLDTVDSGFGECASPGASDSNDSEPTDSLHEYKSSQHSNYVKQWVACSTVEDG